MAHVEWSDKIATAINSPDPRARRLSRQFSRNIQKMIDADLSADTWSVTWALIQKSSIKKWFLGAYRGPVLLDCVNGEMAWIEEAKAAIAAVKQS